MKTRSVGTSTWLLFFGAAAILLIGGFARFDTSGDANRNRSDALVVQPLPILEPGDAVEPAGGPALPSNLSPGLSEIIKLAQAHVGDAVLLAYVQNSGRTYNPTADEILYLTDLGISQKVIEAFYVRNPPDATASSATTAAAPPPSPPGFDPALSSSELSIRTVSAPDPGLPSGAAREGLISPPPTPAIEPQPLLDPTTSCFYDSLAPYGSWVDLGQDGWFWQPALVTTTTGWQPYRDHGRWRYTDSGWYWQSDYSWGWAAFHYGRWLNHPGLGWIWNPGQTWAPAWVAWRNTTEYAGWAPLPPSAAFNLGAGPAFNPSALSVGFAVSASAFTFVPFSEFTSASVGAHAASGGSIAAIFKASTPVNNYLVAGKKIVNLGISTEQIAAATRGPIKQFVLRDVASAGSANNRMSDGGLAVYRPAISEDAPQFSANAANSRLSELDETDDPSVPARNVVARGDDATSSRGDEQSAMKIPGTPPPDARGWSMRRFSLSGGAVHSNPGATRFASRFGSHENGLWSRPQIATEHGGGVRAMEPAPPFFRGAEPSANTSYEGNSSIPRYYNGDASANQSRPANADSRVAAASASASGSKK